MTARGWQPCQAPLRLARTHAGRLVRFGGIGAVNSLVDLGLFLAFVQLLNWHPVPAHVLSYMVAVASSYVLNRLITFRDATGTYGFFNGLLRFLGVGLVGLVLSTASLWAFLMVLPPFPAKLLSILTTLLWNYSASWIFVFKNRKTD